MDNRLIINEHLSIPTSELKFRFTRSRGPGGQNVNKLSTRVELLFDVAKSPQFTDRQRSLIFEKEKRRIDSDGVLRIVSQESRGQSANREEAVSKFIRVLQLALKERKRRLRTSKPKGAVEGRIRNKKKRAELKKLRRSEDWQ